MKSENKQQKEFSLSSESPSKKQMTEQGQLMDVSRMACAVGLRYPVFVSSDLFNNYIIPPRGYEGERSIKGRIWDILWTFKNFSLKEIGSLNFDVVFVCEIRMSFHKMEKIKLRAILDNDEIMISLDRREN